LWGPFYSRLGSRGYTRFVDLALPAAAERTPHCERRTVCSSGSVRLQDGGARNSAAKELDLGEWDVCNVSNAARRTHDRTGGQVYFPASQDIFTHKKDSRMSNPLQWEVIEVVAELADALA